MGRNRFFCLTLLLLITFPLVLPAFASPEVKEDIYAVTLNGRQLSDSVIFLRKDDGNLLVSGDDLKQWRIVPPSGPGITHRGEIFFPLDAFKGLVFTINKAEQSMAMQIAPELFEPTIIDRQLKASPRPIASTGAFLNYDLYLREGDSINTRFDGLFEAVLFNPVGIFKGSFMLSDIGRYTTFTRLETTFSKDFYEKNVTLRVGDIVSSSGWAGIPQRMGGIQLATNFSLSPAYITWPVPGPIGGLASTASVVDVYVNNLLTLRDKIPAGPFEFVNIPLVPGKGEVNLVVKDLLGREQLITRPFYLVPSQLKEGLSDFSYEVGFTRSNYGLKSDDYENFLFSGTHRYGITDNLTGHAHLEIMKKNQMVSLGGTFVIPSIGNFGAHAAGSINRESKKGGLLILSYEYLGSSFNAGVIAQVGTNRFEPASSDTPPLPFKYHINVFLGTALGSYGNITMGFIKIKYFMDLSTTVLSGSYSIKAGPGTIYLSGFKQFEAPVPRESSKKPFGATLTYVIPLDKRRTAVLGQSIDGSSNKDVKWGSVELQQSLPNSNVGYAFKVKAEKGEDHEFLYGNLIRQGENYLVQVKGSRFNNQDSIQVTASGGIALLGGNVLLSRRITDSFCLAEVPGIEGVRVYANKQEVGRTNSSGHLLLPSLLSYQSNVVSIQTDDLPLDSKIGSTAEEVVPAYRSGVKVSFDVKRSVSATMTVTTPDGKPLPSGSTVKSADGKQGWPVAKGGLVYLTDLNPGEILMTSSTGERICNFRVIIPKDIKNVPDIGTFVCE